MTPTDKVKRHYVTVTHGLRGYFAVIVMEYEDGWSEPWMTGIGSYPNVAGAEREAREWAEAEDLPYLQPGEAKN